MGNFSSFQNLWVIEIWVKLCKGKYMGNVGMGKFLKTLPIQYVNIWVNILPMDWVGK